MLMKNKVLVCCHCGVFILFYFLMFVNLPERKEYSTQSQDLVIITFVTSAMIALLLRASMPCLPVSKKNRSVNHSNSHSINICLFLLDRFSHG